MSKGVGGTGEKRIRKTGLQEKKWGEGDWGETKSKDYESTIGLVWTGRIENWFVEDIDYHRGIIGMWELLPLKKI